jgi:hypothetical protein
VKREAIGKSLGEELLVEERRLKMVKFDYRYPGYRYSRVGIVPLQMMSVRVQLLRHSRLDAARSLCHRFSSHSL